MFVTISGYQCHMQVRFHRQLLPTLFPDEFFVVCVVCQGESSPLLLDISFAGSPQGDLIHP